MTDYSNLTNDKAYNEKLKFLSEVDADLAESFANSIKPKKEKPTAVKPLIRDWFIYNRNEITSLVENKFSIEDAKNLVKDPLSITIDETTHIFTAEDYQFYVKGIKMEALLILHGLEPTVDNLSSLRIFFKKNFLHSERIRKIRSTTYKGGTLAYEYALAINESLIPSILSERPYVDYSSNKLAYFKAYQVAPIFNDAIGFANQYYDSDKMSAYHMTNLAKNLLRYGKTPVLSAAQTLQKDLIAISQELDIIEAYDELALLPSLLAYIHEHNPNFFMNTEMVIDMHNLENISTETAVAFIKTQVSSLLSLTTVKLDAKTDYANGYQAGYMQALADLKLDESMHKLTDIESKNQLRKYIDQRATFHMDEISDNLLDTDAPQDLSFKITLDDEDI